MSNAFWALSAKYNRFIFYTCTLLIAASLPLSHFVLSVAQIALAVNWILERDFSKKWERIKAQPVALLLISFFALHVIGLAWTDSGFTYGLKDIRIKLPLLLLPLVYGSSKPLEVKKLRTVLIVFVLGVTSASVLCFINYLGWFGSEVSDARSISLFISHIRFSLLITLSIFVAIYLIINSSLVNVWKTLLLLDVIWLVIFLFILKSMSGIIAFVIALFVVFVFAIIRIKNKLIRSFAIAGVVLLPLIIGLYVAQTVADYVSIKENPKAEIETHSQYGEKYYHLHGDRQTENGYYVNYYIADNELDSAWSKRSEIELSSSSNEGLEFRYTLIRFLTSKGLRKDWDGVMALSDSEVNAIEQGIPNVEYMDANKLEVRIHKILWEIDVYMIGYNPEGNSVGQRFEFWKNGWSIFRDHPIFGVGTGDVQNEFHRAYDENGSLLSEQYQLRAHNQYLTFAITFGVLGLILFLALLIAPFAFNPRSKNFLYTVFFTVAVVSMINEDTLETQIGVTFFAFFYTILLFALPCDQDDVRVA